MYLLVVLGRQFLVVSQGVSSSRARQTVSLIVKFREMYSVSLNFQCALESTNVTYPGGARPARKDRHVQITLKQIKVQLFSPQIIARNYRHVRKT